FRQGVALLHSFWYEEANKTFEQVARQDSTCAMAHWGIAMSLWHQLWDHPDAGTLAEGLSAVRKGKALMANTQRESDYLWAISQFYQKSTTIDFEGRASAYAKAMARIYAKYPADHEAAAFYALSLLASEPEHDTTFDNRKQAAQILEKLFAMEPNHPG